MRWIKMWTEEIIKGTTFSELTASERGVWFSLLALAGIEGTGKIEIRAGQGYSETSLAEILNIEKSELKAGLKKLEQVEKISVKENGVITIKNFSKYQDEYSRQKPYRGRLQEGLQAELQSKLPAEIEKEIEKEIKKEKEKNNAETSSAMYPGGSANNGDYTISTPLQKVVVGWKMITGHEKTDRGWDKLNWGRVAKTARGLLDYFGGDHKQAINCCEDVYKQMLKNKLSCTIETVSKHASEWKLKGENEHN